MRNKIDDDKAFYEVSVVKCGEHKHDVGKKQLRGIKSIFQN